MAAPELPEHLMEVILLLLPPDDPASLLSASFISKSWIRTATRPDFLRRLIERHGGRPPLLGFLHNSGDPRFVPTTASAFPLPGAPDRASWRALDFRHGRALFVSVAADDKGVRDLLVWEPIKGHRRRVPAPPESLKSDFSNGAVLCAAHGCDHLHCHGGPFRVVFVSFDDAAAAGSATSACMYSSEAGTWGEPATLRGTSLDFNQPGVLVGNSLLYFVSECGFLIEYDLANNGLGLLDTPHTEQGFHFHDRFVLMLAENGRLGAVVALESRLHLWAKGADTPWVQTKVIDLANLIPVGPNETSATSPKVMAYADGTNTIFVSTIAGLFTIDLQSEQSRQVSEDRDFYPLIPVASFCIPSWTPQGKPNASEEGAQEENTIERALALFNKGSKAIKEGDFVHAVDCLSHALKIRVALYGQLAPECASTYYKYGCALLLKVQELAVPLGNVPKKARNEESLRSTESKAHTRNSKTPGSNHENTSSLDEGCSGNGQKSNGEDQKDVTGDAKDDDNMAGDDADSELDLAWKMLDLARAIVEQKPDENTMERVKILFALAEISMERDGIDSSLGYYSEALAILEHLVEPDHRRILEINFHLCLVLESASKVGDAIQYCAKAIALCKSRLLKLKNAVEASLADERNAFAADGCYENSSVEDEMDFLAGVVAELEKKLDELEVTMKTPSSAADGTLSRVPPRSPVSGMLSTMCQELSMDL